MTIVERLQQRIRDLNRATDMAHHAKPKIYPPATIESIKSAEAKIGFALPSLLVEIYRQVGNGGFGPGYGLIGLEDGARDDLGNCVVDLFLQNKQHNIQDHFWNWPDRLIPICHWGCAIYSCIDCSYLDYPVINFDPNKQEEDGRWDDAFIPQGTIFAEWIEGWLNGDPQWMYSPDVELIKQLKKLLGEDKKISAIGLYQKSKNCSLDEARKYIDSLQTTHPGK
jgi:hypothetical protein